MKELTLDGWIVLMPGVFGHSGDEISDEQKSLLDVLHLRKIDMSDEVYVINKNGYIGASTRNEIMHAETAGIAVRYMESCLRCP